jgi:hypothetical protein
MHWAVLVVAVLVARAMRQGAREQQIQVAAVAVQGISQRQVKPVVLAVLALSFFATPAQFNISLVAQ